MRMPMHNPISCSSGYGEPYMYRNRVDSTHPLSRCSTLVLAGCGIHSSPLCWALSVCRSPTSRCPRPLAHVAKPFTQDHPQPHPSLTKPITRHRTSFTSRSHLVHISFTRNVSSRLLTHVPRPSSGVIRRHQASSGVISHHQASSGVIRRPTRRSRHQPPCCRSYGRRHLHHQHRHRRVLLRCRQRHRSPQRRPRPPPPLRRA
jgi:hypothetical protein